MRAFLAIPLPDPVLDALEALQRLIPGGRLARRETLHLTLVFLGDVETEALEDLHGLLEARRDPGFPLRLAGLDLFGRDRPRSLHARVGESAPLRALQKSVTGAARRAGVAVERRRFTPHVTLARFGAAGADSARLARLLAGQADWSGPAFDVGAYCLYRSHLRPEGAEHEELARYPLGA